MDEAALCVVLSTSAGSAGYIRWVSPLFVRNSLCGLHQMGELALCMSLFTSARSVGHTRWVLYYHAVAPNPDFHGAAGGPGSPGYLHPTDWQRSWGTIP